MPSGINWEVHGLKETQKEVTRVIKDLHGTPMLEAARYSVLLVQRDARILIAPADTGRARASITPEVRTQGKDIVGIVGSNVKYAPYLELGTRPHWPPLAALEVWARRHGTTAFVVARAIARRGTKPRRFLRGAFEKNKDKIVARYSRAVKGIVR